MYQTLFRRNLQDHLQVMASLEALLPALDRATRLIADSLRQGGKVLLCGNGGSASDCQHIAAELVGRFVHDRPALAAIALTTDTSILTAVANDYGYEQVFARQVAALGRPGDCLIGVSTSGHSANVLAALDTARGLGLCTIGLAGRDGGRMAGRCDVDLVVTSSVTARIQEAHIFIGHLLCEGVEAHLLPPRDAE